MDEDDALERSALRKASWRLLPLIGLGYALSYVDRVNISFAALRMNTDLRFSATVYGVGAGLFFVSYALAEAPSNLALLRFGARRWIAGIMALWGLLAAGMMFVATPTEFYLMRFLLGLAEAGFFPGALYYVTLWFPRAHRGRAISRFYVAAPAASVLMGVVAGWLLSLQGVGGLAGWQWLFLIEGLPAVGLAVLILVFLPDTPRQAPWLSEPEKDWLGRRLAADAAGGAPAEHRLSRALASPGVIALCAANFLILGCFYAFSLSAPTILRERTHLATEAIGYLIAAANAAGVVAMLVNGRGADRRGGHYWRVALPAVLMAVGYAAMSLSGDPTLTMAFYVLTVVANAAIGGVFWLLLGDVLAPRAMAIGIAVINMVGQLGSFALSSLWGVAHDATGGYGAGVAALPVGYLICAAIVMALRRPARPGATPAIAPEGP